MQLVLTSRPDHTPYSVSLDGATSDGDTYSFAPGCGVSWSRSNLSPGSHVLTATAHPLPGRMFLEILSILCACSLSSVRRRIDQITLSGTTTEATSRLRPNLLLSLDRLQSRLVRVLRVIQVHHLLQRYTLPAHKHLPRSQLCLRGLSETARCSHPRTSSLRASPRRVLTQ